MTGQTEKALNSRVISSLHISMFKIRLNLIALRTAKTMGVLVVLSAIGLKSVWKMDKRVDSVTFVKR